MQRYYFYTISPNLYELFSPNQHRVLPLSLDGKEVGVVVQSNKKDYLTVWLDSLVYAPFMEGSRCLEHFHATVDELGECFAFEQSACEERDVYELVHLLVLLGVCGIDALELVAQVC